MVGPVTHAELSRAFERANEANEKAAKALSKVESHEEVCRERWKNQDEAWERQAVSNRLLERINNKMTYWSGGIAVLAFILGLAAAALAK